MEMDADLTAMEALEHEYKEADAAYWDATRYPFNLAGYAPPPDEGWEVVRERARLAKIRLDTARDRFGAARNAAIMGPRKDDRLELRVGSETKAYIMAQGGSAYIRRLVEVDRARAVKAE